VRILSKVVATNATLTTLNLQNVGLGVVERGTLLLCRGLAKNSTLTSLDLSTNNLVFSDMHVLHETLRQSPSTALAALHLRNNRIGSSGASELAAMLKTVISLTKLDLVRCGIGKAGCALLSDALASNTTLRTLRLDCNQLGGNSNAFVLESNTLVNGQGDVASMLKQRLHDAGVSQCGVSPKLWQNTTLQMLSMNHCGFGDDFVAELCTALGGGESGLRHLHLSGNYIRNDGAFHLAELLASSTGIRSIDLSLNSIRDEGGVALGAVLGAHPSLKE
jgi:Ran GTPase-activating protein (RanGAP) involved in mRNA processing and transport